MKHAPSLLRQTQQDNRSARQGGLHAGGSHRRLRPTARDLVWLSHIQLHGPQSSRYLFELTRSSHKCLDTSLRRLQHLREFGYLTLPNQQWQTINTEFNPYVYDITADGKELLYDHGMLEETIRPTGHWWHGYLTSCVISSVEIGARSLGIGFVPTHTILAKNESTIAVSVDNSKLIPDQLFALKYNTGFRAFALEVDRGTEPKLSSTRRKSYARSLALYKKMLSNEIYRKHYGLSANLLILWVFNRRSNEARFLELVSKYAPRSSNSILTMTVNEAELLRAPNTALLDQPWNRSSGETVQINIG